MSDEKYFILAIIMFLVVLLLGIDLANGHEIHFSEVINKDCPVVAQGEITRVGYVFGTDCDGDGNVDAFYKIEKKGGLDHKQGLQLHATPLTLNTAIIILQLRGGLH